MSITINIYYKGVEGNARKFAEEMISSGIVDEIRKESGNLRYEYFFPMAVEVDPTKEELTVSSQAKIVFWGEIPDFTE